VAVNAHPPIVPLRKPTTPSKSRSASASVALGMLGPSDTARCVERPAPNPLAAPHLSRQPVPPPEPPYGSAAGHLSRYSPTNGRASRSAPVGRSPLQYSPTRRGGSQDRQEARSAKADPHGRLG